MGTSCWAHISTAIDWIREVNPRSVLDVGVGFGKWGFLCREYLDVFNGRHFREDWKIRIIGIEGFEKYLHPASRYVYDDILIGDAIEEIERVGEFDLVIMADILEHFTSSKAEFMITQAVARSRAVLIVTPATHWPQGAVHGNEYERHRTVVKHRRVRRKFDVSKYEQFYYRGDKYWMSLLHGKRK